MPFLTESFVPPLASTTANLVKHLVSAMEMVAEVVSRGVRPTTCHHVAPPFLAPASRHLAISLFPLQTSSRISRMSGKLLQRWWRGKEICPPLAATSLHLLSLPPSLVLPLSWNHRELHQASRKCDAGGSSGGGESWICPPPATSSLCLFLLSPPGIPPLASHHCKTRKTHQASRNCERGARRCGDER